MVLKFDKDGTKKWYCEGKLYRVEFPRGKMIAGREVHSIEYGILCKKCGGIGNLSLVGYIPCEVCDGTGQVCSLRNSILGLD